MKKHILNVVLMLITVPVFSQFLFKEGESSGMKFKNIEISFFKTTSIVFPYPIKSVDKGSSEVLVQKAKGVDNILLVKAGMENFKQTNLTVVTADGRMYGYILNYDELCPVLSLAADKSESTGREILFSIENENQKVIEQYSHLVLNKQKRNCNIKRSKNAISFEINGIFVHQDILFFRMVISNNSKIGYDIDQLRFFIKDQKKVLRTASQEIEIQPLSVATPLTNIADQSHIAVVLALPKFTIPEKKYLVIQLFEKDGGRHLELIVKNRKLVNLDVLRTL